MSSRIENSRDYSKYQGSSGSHQKIKRRGFEGPSLAESRIHD